MAHTVTVHTVSARSLAAVRRSAHPGEIGRVWKPALDLVWAFLRSHPGLRTDGHNVFLYHHPRQRDEAMDIDLGVEVARSFADEGEVRLVETPAGEAAVVTHQGAYDKLGEAHAAIHAWREASGRNFAGKSWEVYGDWTEDETRLETQIFYLLA